MEAHLDRGKYAPGQASPPVSEAADTDQPTAERRLEVASTLLSGDMEALQLGYDMQATQRCAPCVKHLRVIDSQSKVLASARREAQAAGLDNVTFERAYDARARLERDSLDAVIAMSTLHQMDDWRGVLRRVHQLLKPGGLFISDTACVGADAALLTAFATLGRLVRLVPKVRFLTRAKLESALVETGFAIEQQWQSSENDGVFIVARKPH